MSNKSPQEPLELEEYVKTIFSMVWRKAESDTADKATVCDTATKLLMNRLHSHMQAGFEYALGKKLDAVKPPEAIVVPVEQLAYNAAFAVNVHLQEQQERAAEWLLGSKESE